MNKGVLAAGEPMGACEKSAGERELVQGAKRAQYSIRGMIRVLPGSGVLTVGPRRPNDDSVHVALSQWGKLRGGVDNIINA